MMRACDVCTLVDGDETPKETGYCGICRAHMCEPCRDDTPRRARAMALRHLKGLRRGLGLDKVAENAHLGDGGGSNE